MVENLEFQRSEIRSGVDAELVIEVAPNLMVCGQGIGLATASV